MTAARLRQDDSATGPMRAPGMADVARRVGVSHQTVSRVVNGHPDVAATTRTLVLAAITELGFRPNLTARSLATGRSDTIGVVAQTSTLFGPANMLAAIDRSAAESGFSVVVSSVSDTDTASIERAIDRHLANRVSAIVVIVPVVGAAKALLGVPDSVPIVVVDGEPSERHAVVTVDQREGGRLATEHLLSLGHKTVWHVSGPHDWFDARGRLHGWQSALECAGADVPPVIAGDWSAASGYEAGRMLARMEDATAVFCANDHQALGVLRAMSERGRRVPFDVAIVGFDDVPESEFFSPPLTTVRPDFAGIARHAVAKILARFDTPGVNWPSSALSLPPLLIPRLSTVSAPCASGWRGTP